MSVITHFLLWRLHLASASTMYTAAECTSLERHAARKTRLAEIGCWHGVNTRRLRTVMAPDGVLFAVDPYAPGRLGFSAPQIIAHREVAKETNGAIRWIRMHDLDAARWFVAEREAPLDFVFSDSLNSFEGFRATWEAWSPLMMPGGRYVLANSRSSATKQLDDVGSVVCTRELIMRDPRFRLLETVDTFTILEKR
jgi:hypothetical protein